MLQDGLSREIWKLVVVQSSMEGRADRRSSPKIALGQTQLQKSPSISPNRESKPTISRTRSSTLIPRGIHGDQKRPDKQITSPSPTNKPRITPRQKTVSEKKRIH